LNRLTHFILCRAKVSELGELPRAIGEAYYTRLRVLPAGVFTMEAGVVF